MPASGGYGEALGRRLNAQASSFTTRALPRGVIAVTELYYTNPQNGLSTPPREEDAFMAGVHLNPYPRYEYWEDGKPAPSTVLKPGETVIYDLKRRPTFRMNSEFHTVHFYLPRAALNALADAADARRIGSLHYRPAVSHDDPVLRSIAQALLPVFRAPELASRLFLDHMMLAAGHHIAFRYGGMRPPARFAFGGLTPSQERRAKELLAANLSGDLPLEGLACECGLSLSQFRKAFRKSVGAAPHQWVIRQRLILAKALLREGRLPLAEIALQTGFSDQSHFTRFFSAAIGISPGAWRKTVRN